MPTAKRFVDLEIWQSARVLVKKVYGITNRPLFSKDFSLKDQIRRSSVGVMNNISEEFESRTVNLFIDYLGRAKGSCGETRSVLYVALDQNYITKTDFDDLYELCTKISSKTFRLIQYLEKYDLRGLCKTRDFIQGQGLREVGTASYRPYVRISTNRTERSDSHAVITQTLGKRPVLQTPVRMTGLWKLE